MSTVGFHVTEDCAEVYLQNESGMEFLQLARRLHDYLQQGQRLPARSLFEATDGCKEISHEKFDALAKHRKGDLVSVAGNMQVNQWTGQDGGTQTGYQVIAGSVISARTVRPGGKAGQQGQATDALRRAQQPSRDEYDQRPPFDDEAPF